MELLCSLARLIGLSDDSRGSVALADLFRSHTRREATQEDARLTRAPLSEGPRSRHLVLVHGNYWKDALAPVGDPNERLFLLKPLMHDPRFADLCRRFAVYVFIYPTHQDVRMSGRALADLLIREIGPLRGPPDVTIVAHSLGGLVARWSLHHQGLGERLCDLITLATPHHGTILASAVRANSAIRSKVGLFGLLCQRISRRIWPPNDGLAGMEYDNLDELFPQHEIDRMGVPVNEPLARLNRNDRFLERVTCVMGRVRGRWLAGRNLFDQMPRWLFRNVHPQLRGLDPLVHVESGLAAGLLVRARHILDDLDHEGIVTSEKSRDLVFRLLFAAA